MNNELCGGYCLSNFYASLESKFQKVSSHKNLGTRKQKL